VGDLKKYARKETNFSELKEPYRVQYKSNGKYVIRIQTNLFEINGFSNLSLWINFLRNFLKIVNWKGAIYCSEFGDYHAQKETFV